MAIIEARNFWAEQAAILAAQDVAVERDRAVCDCGCRRAHHNLVINSACNNCECGEFRTAPSCRT